MRGLSILLLTVTATLFPPQRALPQHEGRWIHRSWTIEDGLPQNTVTSIARTPDGYLWLGTVKGLARFDGIRFTGYEVANAPGLAGDRISTTFVDDRGSLWIGTEFGGVSRYRDGTFSRIDEEATPPTGFVRQIGQDPAGNILVLVGGQVYRVDADTLRSVQISFDGRSVGVGAMHLDTDGVLSFGSSVGLLRWQDDQAELVDTLSEIPSSIRDIAEGPDGRMWIISDEHLGRFDGRVLDFIPVGFTGGQKLFLDSRNRVWISLLGRGPVQLVSDSLSDSEIPEPLHGAFIRDFFEDSSGSIWIAGGDDGLHLLRKPLFDAHTPPKGPPGGSVLHVGEDSAGAIWTATLSAGLFRLVDDGFEQYSLDEGLPGEYIRVMAVSNAGRTWAMTRGILTRFTGERFEPAPLLPSLQGQGPRAVSGMTARARGGVWLAYAGQIRYYHDGSYSEPVVVHELDGKKPVEMTDVSGTLWFSPGVGMICRLNDSTYGCFGQQAGLPDVEVRDVFRNSDGSHWLGTYGGGLCQLDEGRVTCLSKEHGLPDNTVHRIIEDDFGFVWLSSNRGVSRMRRSDVERFFSGDRSSVAPDVYGELDGMPSRECNIGGLKASDGTIWFPTMKGLASVRPEDALGYRTERPQTLIEEVLVDGRPAEGESLKFLPAGSDRIEIHYTGIQLENPEMVRFRIRLNGHDENWVDAGTRRTATYTNLPPGDYTFEVQSALGSSGWSETAVASLGIEPFVYQTWWFRALAAVALLALLGAGYRIRLNRVIERERWRKTEAEARRLAELDAAKSRFFANISHEFRTPLTLIISHFEEALKNDRLEKSERGRYQSVLNNARRLLGLIDKLLDLSRLDSGKLELKPADGELVSFVGNLVRSFMPLAERRKVELNFRSDIQHRPSRFDPDRLQSILGNLLSNALKYTPEGGKVWVTLAEHGVGGVEFVVKDTGPGIPREKLEHIFERYERGEDEAESGSIGSGIGLALAKELVDLHGGVMLVESEEGFGTAFIVRLPLPRFDRTVEPVEVPAEKDEVERALTDEPVDASSDSRGEPAAPDRPLVLVIEDHDEVRRLIVSQLSDEFLVVEARHGLEGLSKARAHKPDLVLTDVMMPGLDGVELCRRLKGDPRLAEIPVVMLTAKVGDEHAVEALNAGADDYISKPYNADTLRHKLAHLIDVRASLRERYSRQLVVPSTGATIESADKQFVGRVLALVEERLGNATFNVEELASEIGLSRRQLTRRMKATLGEAPSDLIHRMRLERAAELLESRAGTVSEVAYQVGFRSASHFGAAFKEAYGHTPGEHIENGT